MQFKCSFTVYSDVVALLLKQLLIFFSFLMTGSNKIFHIICRKLFELLVLSGALAELTWPTILNKGPIFRYLFANFDI
jgi:hypothetical protein